jgi:LysM repeat protein
MDSKPPYEAIDNFRKRQRNAPRILGVIAFVFVAAGFVLIYLWWNSGTSTSVALFPTPTLSPTITSTPIPPTETLTITVTSSITTTPTITLSPTPNAPFPYTVQEGDTLSSIAEQFGVEVLTIMMLNGMTNESILLVNQELIIPDPNTGLPSPTPIPTNLRPGSVIEYMVLPGDSLASIAAQFNSTEESIIDENDLDDPNAIFIGQILLVPIELITVTPTPLETVTPSPLETFTPTESPTPRNTPTAAGS